MPLPGIPTRPHHEFAARPGRSSQQQRATIEPPLPGPPVSRSGCGFLASTS
ncbi:hypothetical protein [Mycolicibacterium frederiksbergense]|uniref:hypothetical protein n=1 Tax=Mycolicibacterium frederiksbergense TaxID=117567 RepID=UPI00143AA9F2|nr:hypothetical protein [Mycolicibacterium frederiksbergense]